MLQEPWRNSEARNGATARVLSALTQYLTDSNPIPSFALMWTTAEMTCQRSSSTQFAEADVTQVTSVVTMATMATGTTAGITAIGTTAIGTTVGATAIGLGLVLALALTTTAAPTAIGCTATIIVAG
jgi:hypothetical protein